MEDITLTMIQETIKQARAVDGFVNFMPTIENQLMEITKLTSKLYFRVDVSGGKKQAFQTCWIRVRR